MIRAYLKRAIFNEAGPEAILSRLFIDFVNVSAL